MIDLHAHVLPGLDDGPATMDDALALARAMADSGTRMVAATPHIDHHWDVRVDAVRPAVAALRTELERAEIELEVIVGGEIALPRILDLAPADLDELGLGEAGVLLLEAPIFPLAIELVERSILAQLADRPVLIAHPERCPAFQREPERVAALVEAGARCQLTASALSGRFGGDVRRFALLLLREGLVHDVASDAHDPRRRPPALREPFAAAEKDLPGLGAQIEWLTAEAPRALLAGDELPPLPPLPPPRSPHWWQREGRQA